MRVIDRLYKYLQLKQLSPYAFERNCAIANGYLKKQTKGKGSIGSEILEKIIARHSDLSLIWLLTGKGDMLIQNGYPEPRDSGRLSEEEALYPQSQLTKLLHDQIEILQKALADKEKIIQLLEQQLAKGNTPHPKP